MLRVCHLGKYYPPARGGFETHLGTLARSQAELGADVRVLCINHRDRHGRDVTWNSLAPTATIEETDGPVRVCRLGRRVELARLDLSADLFGALARLRRERVDLLHLHVPNPTMLLGLVLVWPDVPLVVTYHSDVVRQRYLGLLQRPFEHLILRRAANLVCNAPPYLDGSALLRQYRRKVTILPMGLDLEPFLHPNPAARRHTADLQRLHGNPLWLSVGRLVYYKGLDQAVRALKHVPGRLLVIGTGPCEVSLRELARTLGVADRIHWRGPVEADELIGAYHAADALWFPSNSRSEAFGLVQVEAMASGCPVINAAIPGSGVPWVSRHEETGLTVPVDDAEALAASAHRLLAETGLRTRLAEQARLRACQEFDQRIMARRTLELYEHVLRHRRCDRRG